MSTERIVGMRVNLLAKMEQLVRQANEANRQMEETAIELEQLDKALLDESRRQDSA